MKTKLLTNDEVQTCFNNLKEFQKRNSNCQVADISDSFGIPHDWEDYNYQVTWIDVLGINDFDGMLDGCLLTDEGLLIKFINNGK